MATIGNRLQMERKSLRLSQTDFAAACGQSKASQIRYEADERLPDGNYLAKALELGADVIFILSGKRASERAAESTEAYKPSERVAQVIRDLVLSEADAELLMALASRLARGE